MGISRQEYWSGLPCLPRGDLPNPGIEPISHVSCIAGRFFTTSTTWEVLNVWWKWKLLSHIQFFVTPLVYGILQTRILEQIPLPFSRGSSQPRDRTQIFCIAGGFFTSWATREALNVWFNSVQFSHSVVSDCLWPHELQHARPPCPSPTPGDHSNSCPSSQWCHPSISSFVVRFSSCPQSLPASESFPINQLFACMVVLHKYNSQWKCRNKSCKAACQMENFRDESKMILQSRSGSIRLPRIVGRKSCVWHVCTLFWDIW